MTTDKPIQTRMNGDEHGIWTSTCDIHHPGIGVANSYVFDISTRKGEYGKNEEDWDDHLAMDFDAQVEQLKLPFSSDDLSSFAENFGKI